MRQQRDQEIAPAIIPRVANILPPVLAKPCKHLPDVVCRVGGNQTVSRNCIGDGHLW